MRALAFVNGNTYQMLCDGEKGEALYAKTRAVLRRAFANEFVEVLNKIAKAGITASFGDFCHAVRLR